MIAVSSSNSAFAERDNFPVDESKLRSKVPTQAVVSNEYYDWTAMYGRIESPRRLKPHRPPVATERRNVPGNGYGANGSVPAKIVVFISKTLVRGRGSVIRALEPPQIAFPPPPLP
jgi:hypothetical protein